MIMIRKKVKKNSLHFIQARKLKSEIFQTKNKKCNHTVHKSL